MSVKEQYWKYSLITIILGLGLILFIKMSPFMGGILGAGIEKQTTNRGWWQVIAGTGKVKESRKPLM